MGNDTLNDSVAEISFEAFHENIKSRTKRTEKSKHSWLGLGCQVFYDSIPFRPSKKPVAMSSTEYDNNSSCSTNKRAPSDPVKSGIDKKQRSEN